VTIFGKICCGSYHLFSYAKVIFVVKTIYRWWWTSCQ